MSEAPYDYARERFECDLYPPDTIPGRAAYSRHVDRMVAGWDAPTRAEAEADR